MTYEELIEGIPESFLGGRFSKAQFEEMQGLYIKKLEKLFPAVKAEYFSYAAWHLLFKKADIVIQWLEQKKLYLPDWVGLNRAQLQILANNPLIPTLIETQIFTMRQVLEIGLYREDPRLYSQQSAQPIDNVNDLDIIFVAFNEFSENHSGSLKASDPEGVRHFLIDFLQDFFSGGKMASLKCTALEKFFPLFKIHENEYQEPVEKYKKLFTSINIPSPDVAKKILSQREFSRALRLYKEKLTWFGLGALVEELNYTAWYLLSKRGGNVIQWLQEGGKRFASHLRDLNLTQSLILADHPLIPILIEKKIFTIYQILKIGFYVEWFDTNGAVPTIFPDPKLLVGFFLTVASARPRELFRANAEKLDIIFRAFNGFVGDKVGKLHNLKSSEDVREFLSNFWRDSVALKSAKSTISEKDFQGCFRPFFPKPVLEQTTVLASAPAPAPAAASALAPTPCAELPNELLVQGPVPEPALAPALAPASASAPASVSASVSASVLAPAPTPATPLAQNLGIFPSSIWLLTIFPPESQQRASSAGSPVLSTIPEESEADDCETVVSPGPRSPTFG